jgi:hypothetical protein
VEIWKTSAYHRKILRNLLAKCCRPEVVGEVRQSGGVEEVEVRAQSADDAGKSQYRCERMGQAAYIRRARNAQDTVAV